MIKIEVKVVLIGHSHTSTTLYSTNIITSKKKKKSAEDDPK